MSSQEFHQLLEILPALSLEQLQLLRHECDVATLSVKNEAPRVIKETEQADQQAQHRLLAAGLLSEIKPPIRNFASYLRREAVPIVGEPLSETVIRERR